MSESTALAARRAGVLDTDTREGWSLVARKADALAGSSMIPEAFRGKPENCLIAMEYATRLGCSVLAVMQNLDVIHGRPSLRATFLIGTVNASGRFTPIRFRWQGEGQGDEWGCRAHAIDRDSGEECEGPLITIGLAKAEGWYAKSGSKWKTIPELMLQYRAAAWWTRVYAPELALGLHTTDEVEDMGPSAVSPRAHAAAVSAALHRDDEIPTAEATIVSGGTAPTTTTQDPKAAEYEAALLEREISGEDREAFEARLFKEGKVQTDRSANWSKQDFRSAIAELATAEVG